MRSYPCPLFLKSRIVILRERTFFSIYLMDIFLEVYSSIILYLRKDKMKIISQYLKILMRYQQKIISRIHLTSSGLIKEHATVCIDILSQDVVPELTRRIKEIEYTIQVNGEDYNYYITPLIDINKKAIKEYFEKKSEENNPSFSFIFKKIKKNAVYYDKVLCALSIVLIFFPLIDEPSFFEALFNYLKKNYLELIKYYCEKEGIRIAFFYPNKAFRGNFGFIPDALASKNMKFISLFSELPYASHEPDNFFIVIDDMITRLDCINAFFIPSIMNCLPTNAISILIDHTSFAIFSPYKRKWSTEDSLQNSLSEKYKESYTHALAYFPLIDYHLVSSIFLQSQFEKWLSFYGYTTDKKKISSSSYAKSLLKALPKKDIRKRVFLIQGGYPKLDKLVAYSKKTLRKNIIIYAPTPNDKGGNKEDWLPFMSINTHAKSILETLCSCFPNFEIVFKPHL